MSATRKISDQPSDLLFSNYNFPIFLFSQPPAPPTRISMERKRHGNVQRTRTPAVRTPRVQADNLRTTIKQERTSPVQLHKSEFCVGTSDGLLFYSNLRSDHIKEGCKQNLSILPKRLKKKKT